DASHSNSRGQRYGKKIAGAASNPAALLDPFHRHHPADQSAHNGLAAHQKDEIGAMRPRCGGILEPIQKFAPGGGSGHGRRDDPSAVEPIEKIPSPPAIPEVQPESHGVGQGLEYPVRMQTKRTD